MAQFRLNDAENYGGNGAGFFSLKDDGDSKPVRFMYTSVDDIQGYAVHRIGVNGRNRYVNCLREYNEPIDSCPLCKARNFQSGKFFFSLYDIDEDTVLIWDRGKNILKRNAMIRKVLYLNDKEIENIKFESPYLNEYKNRIIKEE